MFYSLIHLLNQTWHYILNLKLTSDISSGPLLEDEPEDYQEAESIYVGEFFRNVDPFHYIDVFSTDKSTLQCITYGSDVNEFIEIIDDFNRALACDEYFNLEAITSRRSKGYLRNLFLSRSGDILHPLDRITKLRESSIRLSDSLALRNLNPSLGFHFEQNRSTAIFVLRDLYNFFRESDLDYDENRTLRGRSIYFG